MEGKDPTTAQPRSELYLHWTKKQNGSNIVSDTELNGTKPRNQSVPAVIAQSFGSTKTTATTHQPDLRPCIVSPPETAGSPSVHRCFETNHRIHPPCTGKDNGMNAIM